MTHITTATPSCARSPCSTRPPSRSTEIARTQDEEVGDGTTTSVIVLTGEMLAVAEPFLAPEDADTLHRHQPRRTGAPWRTSSTSWRTRSVWSIQGPQRGAVHHHSCLRRQVPGQVVRHGVQHGAGRCADGAARPGRPQGDRHQTLTPRSKIPGGTIEESQVLCGVLVNKDVTLRRCRRRIENPRFAARLPFEYKKGESQTNIEMMKEEDFQDLEL